MAIVAFVLFLLNGQTIITGEYEGQKIVETLVCESKVTAYPIFKYDNASSKDLKINAAFDNDKIETISLIYRLNYTDKEEINFSEARNHSAMNQSFNSDGLQADALSAKYGVLNDGLQLSIYAKGEDINSKTLKYFMANSITNMKDLTKEKLAKIYNAVGLDCKIRK
jgi:hypothetical protein